MMNPNEKWELGEEGGLCFQPSMSYNFDCDELKKIIAKVNCVFIAGGIIYHLLTCQTT